MTSDLDELVLTILASFGHDAADLQRDAVLHAIDVDSLDLIELVEILAEDHGIVIDEQQLGDVRPETVGDVLDAIAREAPSTS